MSFVWKGDEAMSVVRTFTCEHALMSFWPDILLTGSDEKYLVRQAGIDQLEVAEIARDIRLRHSYTAFDIIETARSSAFPSDRDRSCRAKSKHLAGAALDVAQAERTWWRSVENRSAIDRSTNDPS